ncbi:MAG: tRNA guanosine(34) transglycosylase Tgt [Deltaproteobacteria bacterium]|nr:tRNA guanosine(34) transglycosylase Tgt [Deltaproteobacteria bacterium]
MIKVEEITKDGKARHCKIIFDDAFVALTPLFMPVATRGTLKAIPLAESDLKHKFQILLANSWHLLLKPGVETIKRHGSIKQFMNWPNKILTDSGGFQIFSLAKNVTILPEGVKFLSPYNSQYFFLTPTEAIENQADMGVDIAMQLDICSADPYNRSICTKDLELTEKWAELTVEHADRKNLSVNIFGISQGGMFEDLREKSLQNLNRMPFSGIALGGLSVGEKKSDMYRILKFCSKLLPKEKPRYVMGLGLPLDIVVACYFGYDMFDCVLPTRAARFGRAYVTDLSQLWLNLRSSEFKNDTGPVDPNCRCYCCRNYSRSYICHLLKVDEIVGGILLTLHNLEFMFHLLKGIRLRIRQKLFEDYAKQYIRSWLQNSKFVSIIGQEEREALQESVWG